MTAEYTGSIHFVERRMKSDRRGMTKYYTRCAGVLLCRAIPSAKLAKTAYE